MQWKKKKEVEMKIGTKGCEKMSYDVKEYEVHKYTSNVYQSQLHCIDKYQILKYSADGKQIIITDDKCDKYDYLAAIACGAIGGLVDIFLVGTPGNSKLGDWTDKQVGKAVMSFAKKMGWKPSDNNANNVKSAIGFLEHSSKKTSIVFSGFKVNYDQRKPSDVNNKFVIAPQTHHMMSLGHSPDIVGLFFSILNQFTNTSSFIADGKLITINTEQFELYGGDFVMKLLCGIANWFGHLMSDVAGSSGAHSRGTGIVIPFYELFGFCKFNKFSTKEGVKDLAQLAQSAYIHGYDARFGLAMAIPVVITDVTIRLIWGMRQYFQYGKPLRECLPLEKKHADLRIMLIFGQGTLCLFDAIDAVVESGGCALIFFLHMNLVAWFRFGTLVFKEICIRYKISKNEQVEAPAYRRLTSEINGNSSNSANIDDQITDKFVDELDSLQSSSEIRRMVTKLIN